MIGPAPPVWLHGPWLAPDLYPQQLLADVIDSATDDALIAKLEIGAGGARLSVRLEERPYEVARLALLDLLTTATRTLIERDLVP